MTTNQFAEVIEAWQHADANHIHPLRRASKEEYWASGVAQAEQAAQYIPAGGRVLDFGCGEGRLAIPLAQMGFDVIAADAAPAMLDRLRKRARSQKVRLQVAETDGSNLVTLVDAVVCRAVLIHHAHEDVARLVGAFSAILKPGGVLIADWPTGKHHERRDWIDVTTWVPKDRQLVAERVGLELIADGTPSVWRKL